MPAVVRVITVAHFSYVINSDTLVQRTLARTDRRYTRHDINNGLLDRRPLVRGILTSLTLRDRTTLTLDLHVNRTLSRLSSDRRTGFTQLIATINGC